MILPSLLSRVEDRCEFSRFWIKRTYIAPFACVTSEAGIARLSGSDCPPCLRLMT